MTSENGITNTEIKRFFDDEMNDDLKRNFMGLCSSDSITKYINFYNIIKEKESKISICNFQLWQKK